MKKLENRLREGGGASRIEKQHRARKLTARERIDGLLDAGRMGCACQQICKGGAGVARGRARGAGNSRGVAGGA